MPTDDPLADECPICHSKRYLRRDMRFLINPECYHRMCESCVDRIFSHGPAPCPVARCNKTLRRHRFRIPTFGDLALEREVDIRRSVAKVFNRREQDFESLRAYNDYLNDVEDITFNLINNIHVEDARAKLEAYAQANASLIAQNRKMEVRETEELKSRIAENIAESDRSRREAYAADVLERQERFKAAASIIESLAAGGDAVGIVRAGERALNRRPGQKAAPPTTAQTGSYSNFSIAGLRKHVAPEEEKPFDPFDGISDLREYVTMPSTFDSWDSYLGQARKDEKVIAGGYDLGEFYSRSLIEAFSGLGVFVGKEMAEKDVKRAGRKGKVEQIPSQTEQIPIKMETS
jgi:CDK-activating kinase assembly factor MAT1